jgi:hypothetical protein
MEKQKTPTVARRQSFPLQHFGYSKKHPFFCMNLTAARSWSCAHNSWRERYSGMDGQCIMLRGAIQGQGNPDGRCGVYAAPMVCDGLRLRRKTPAT